MADCLVIFFAGRTNQKTTNAWGIETTGKTFRMPCGERDKERRPRQRKLQWKEGIDRTRLKKGLGRVEKKESFLIVS